MGQVRAKKALGQHFLTDLSIAERIADTLKEDKKFTRPRDWSRYGCAHTISPRKGA